MTGWTTLHARLVALLAALLMLLIVLSACAPRAKAIPSAFPPESRYGDFIARKESIGRYWEETLGVACKYVHVSAIPIRFCEDPEYPGFFVAYARCKEEILGEAHGIRYRRGSFFPDFSRMRVHLFKSQNGGAAVSAIGRLPRAETVENAEEITRTTIWLPLEGGGEAALVIERPEERCYELTDPD